MKYVELSPRAVKASNFETTVIANDYSKVLLTLQSKGLQEVQSTTSHRYHYFFMYGQTNTVTSNVNESIKHTHGCECTCPSECLHVYERDRERKRSPFRTLHLIMRYDRKTQSTEENPPIEIIDIFSLSKSNRSCILP